MKVVGYLGGIPSPHKNLHKTKLISSIIEGVNKTGDIGILHQHKSLIHSDIGLIQGWVHADSRHVPHLNLRRQVIANTHNKHTLIIDSNLFNYKVGLLHKMQYTRFSLDNIFPTQGYYFDSIVKPDRWSKISKNLNLTLKPYRKTGSHILVCTQRNGGWSMKGLPVFNWLVDILNQLQKLSDRPIVVRTHPGDKKSRLYTDKIRFPNVTISKKQSICEDFLDAWAVVTYNSSPGVAAAIEGLPCFITDPNPKDSQAYDIGNYSLQDIENPLLKNRENWVEKIAMSHWNLDETASGEAWQHFKTCLESIK